VSDVAHGPLVQSVSVVAMTLIWWTEYLLFTYTMYYLIGCSDAYTVGQYQQNSVIYWESTMKVEDCEVRCNADSFCEGFAYRTDNSFCQLATSNDGTPNIFCGSCYFHKRQCSGAGTSTV
jgi:hypothetical protein